MMIGVKGKQLCTGNQNAAGQTDGRTDRRMDGQTDMVIPVYPPPNFVAGGIIIMHYNTSLYKCNEHIKMS